MNLKSAVFFCYRNILYDISDKICYLQKRDNSDIFIPKEVVLFSLNQPPVSKGERGSGRGGGSILQIATLRPPPFSACKVVKCNLKAGSLRHRPWKTTLAMKLNPTKKFCQLWSFSSQPILIRKKNILLLKKKNA